MVWNLQELGNLFFYIHYLIKIIFWCGLEPLELEYDGKMVIVCFSWG